MRNPTFDIMKGIGIIAMIIGHCGLPKTITSIIFMWHMPLFFIISGYFFKVNPIKEFFAKNFRSLMIPYLLTAVSMFLIACVYNSLGKNYDLLNSFVAIFVAAGSKGVPQLGHYMIGAV